MNRPRVLSTVALLVAFGAVGETIATSMYPMGRHTAVTDPDDFRAFYCAGQVLLHGHDPYLTEPLRSCEHASARVFALGFARDAVDPAPLPPYALAFFALFGALPFAIASTVWFLLSLASLGTATFLTARLSGANLGAIATSFVVAGALVSTSEGQLAPLLTAALCVAAYAMREASPRATALGLGFAAIEPHVSVASAVLAALADRRMRTALAIVVALLCPIEMFAGGPRLTAEYATVVLPLHALTEIDSIGQQFGLTTMLWALGMPTSLAAIAGTLDFFAMALLGIGVGFALRKRFDDPAFLILTPATFVLFGGEYIHLFQMVVALPLAYICYNRFARTRLLVAVAIVGLSIPAHFLVVNSTLRAHFYPPSTIVATTAPAWRAGPSQIAESTMMALRHQGQIERPDARALWLATLPKLPTWLALLALISACCFEAFAAEKIRRRTTQSASGV